MVHVRCCASTWTECWYRLPLATSRSSGGRTRMTTLKFSFCRSFVAAAVASVDAALCFSASAPPLEPLMPRRASESAPSTR